MKKEYKKPFILFESFTLSTSIAATCEHNVGATETTCTIVSSGGIETFSSAIGSACEYPYDSSLDSFKVPGRNDTFCYHVPTDATNIFGS